MITREFLLAGKAKFTLTNPTKLSIMFAVKLIPASEQYPRTTYFAYYYPDPDNQRKRCYIGIVDAATGRVILTRKSVFKDSYPAWKRAKEKGKVPDKPHPVAVLEWALRKAWANEPFPDGYQFIPSGNCARCGHKLKDEESLDPRLRSGIGPECYQMIFGRRKPAKPSSEVGNEQPG